MYTFLDTVYGTETAEPILMQRVYFRSSVKGLMLNINCSSVFVGVECKHMKVNHVAGKIKLRFCGSRIFRQTSILVASTVSFNFSILTVPQYFWAQKIKK